MLARGSTHQRPHPRGDFVNRERLRQVVIRSKVQAFNSFIYVPARGEKQHWRVHALTAHLAQDTEPVASWQHDVEYDRIVCLSANLSERRATVMHEVNHQILLREAVAQKASEFFFVFDDQYSHPQNLGESAKRREAGDEDNKNVSR